MVNKQRLIKLTQKLIQINSQNPPGNEAEIVRFIKKYLENFGLSVKVYEFSKDRPNIVGLLKSENLKAKTILISPHLDTVPVGRNWKLPPFSGLIKDNKIYGRGATDCKGNLAVSIEALNSIIEDRIKIKNNVLFAATADEEAGSDLGLIPLLKKNILKADYALILDSDEFEIVIAQKGLIHFKVSISGRSAHGAYPWRGLNAIDNASAIIQDLKSYRFNCSKHNLLHPPTINIGTIKGGDKVNMVADWCEFEVDLRYLPGMQAKNILRDLKKFIYRRAKRFKIDIEGVQQPYEISKKHNLVGSLLAVWRKYSHSAKLKGSEGATVITFFKERGIPAVASGFGSKGCAHISDEYVDISNLCIGARALEEFLKGEGKNGRRNYKGRSSHSFTS